MNKKEYIAYQGTERTIEWFYNIRGRSQALEYAENMTDTQKAKLLAVLERMGNMGQLKDKTKFRSEGQKIYAFKDTLTASYVFSLEIKKLLSLMRFARSKTNY